MSVTARADFERPGAALSQACRGDLASCGGRFTATSPHPPPCCGLRLAHNCGPTPTIKIESSHTKSPPPPIPAAPDQRIVDDGRELLEQALRLEKDGELLEAINAYETVAAKYARTPAGLDAQKRAERLWTEVEHPAGPNPAAPLLKDWFRQHGRRESR